MRKVLFGMVVALVLVGLGIAIGLYSFGPRLTDEETKSLVMATLLEEAPEAFLVTGSLSYVAQVERNNRKWVSFMGQRVLDLGTTSVEVRAPVEATYGVDLNTFGSSNVRIVEGGMVEIVLPRPQVRSVDVAMDRMEVETQTGWARRQSSSGNEQEREALSDFYEAANAQAKERVRGQPQAHANTSQAIRTLVIPVLRAAGVETPRVTVRFEDEPL